ncbi:syntaxin-binding protein 4-like [Leucoraja erinacea]|uniref:syntaxin-binding protein 4-like n=1 Tax=Leucoraja erinaceus TaxID=7782 RepID=UPI0024585BF5|nr:syntaxin-binding protein 4-like [Leucoraja erinacea]
MFLMFQVVAPGAAGAADLDRTTRERNEALKELKKVKDQLVQSEKSRKTLSEELQKVRQEARCAVEEGRSLRGRAHLAEAAQRHAHMPDGHEDSTWKHETHKHAVRGARPGNSVGGVTRVRG